jgi:hypothetical protein
MSSFIDETTDKIDKKVSEVFKSIDEIPSHISNKAGEVENAVSDKLTNVAKVTKALVDEKVSNKVAGDLSEVSGKVLENINTDEISKLASNGISAAVTAVAKGFVDGLYANPIVGSATKLATSVLDAGGKLAETGSKMVNVVTKSVDKALLDSELTPHPPPITGHDTNRPEKGGRQAGGAKTRRHLKKMIRQRELIQTRTKKMIREFMNPIRTTSKNKKHIIKQTKRHRRRH